MKQKNNWQTKKLEKCIEKVAYGNKVPRKKFLKTGKFPIVSQEINPVNGYWDNKEDLFEIERPVVVFGDHTKVFKYIEFDFVLGADGVKILKPQGFLHPKFFYYQLIGLNLKSLGYARHYRILKEKNIIYPPLPEQKRIVKILDEVFEKIEKAKENTKQNLKNSKELFEAVLQRIFEENKRNWGERELGIVYDVRDGTHDSPKYQEEGYALITSKNLKKDSLDYKKIKYISEQDYLNINKRSKVDKGDVLFAMIGTIGNPVVVEVDPDFAIKNVALFKIPKEQSSYFLKYYLDSKFVIDKMRIEAKGTTQKFVGLGYLRGFKINLPTFIEQKKIVKKLNTLSKQTKKLEKIYQQKLDDLEELKKSVLKKAFEGEL